MQTVRYDSAWGAIELAVYYFQSFCLLGSRIAIEQNSELAHTKAEIDPVFKTHYCNKIDQDYFTSCTAIGTAQGSFFATNTIVPIDPNNLLTGIRIWWDDNSITAIRVFTREAGILHKREEDWE